MSSTHLARAGLSAFSEIGQRLRGVTLGAFVSLTTCLGGASGCSSAGSTLNDTPLGGTRPVASRSSTTGPSTGEAKAIGGSGAAGGSKSTSSTSAPGGFQSSGGGGFGGRKASGGSRANGGSSAATGGSAGTEDAGARMTPVENESADCEVAALPRARNAPTTITTA